MKKSILLLTAFVSINVYNSSTAMNLSSCISSKAVDKAARTFTVTSALSEWTTLNPLSTKEEMDKYKETWNYAKTLEENQKTLASAFIDTCCNLDFPICKFENIYIGKSNDTGYLAIIPDAVVIGGKCTIKIPAHVDVKGAAKAPSADIQSVQPKQQEQIRDIIREITKSAVGCKLFRVMIAKYRANKYAKIAFVSVKNERTELDASIAASYFAPMNSKSCTLTSNDVVFFIPELLKDELFSAEMVGYNPDSKKLKLYTGSIALDTIFFHEFSHIILPPTLLTSFSSTIARRFSRKIENPENRVLLIPYANKSFGSFFPVEDSVILKELFESDNEYANMFGLTQAGLWPINEALYTSTKYGYVRAFHKDNSQLTFYFTGPKLTIDLCPQEVSEFIRSFFETYGDEDLHRFYLDPAYPKKPKLPRFGMNQYQCLDLDSTTGASVLPSPESTSPQKDSSSNSNKERK